MITDVGKHMNREEDLWWKLLVVYVNKKPDIKGVFMVNLLFASASMQEAGPFKAGLLTTHPENRGNPHHQHHQVFN